MTKRINIIEGICILLMIFLISSCGNMPLDDEERRLRMVYTEWSESIAITYLSAVLLEQKMEYKVELKLTDIESAYREIAGGEADVFADAWLPETHRRYIDLYPDKIERTGITYPEARIGFVVPDYSPLRTIADLKNYDGILIGIDKGAGVMQKAVRVIENYSLPNRLLNLSEEEMLNHLEDSVKRRKEIVVTGWEPHWMFARYELRFLEDPDNFFGKDEKIFTIGRIGLEEVHPHAVRFFERMQLSEKQLNKLLYQLHLSEDPREAVLKWIRENEYVVNQWVKNLSPERKKIM